MGSKTLSKSSGLPPTPACPDNLSSIELSKNSSDVLTRRYLRRGSDGKPIETIKEMFWRVAYHVAKVESEKEEEIQKRAIAFYELMSSKRFFPNSPTTLEETSARPIFWRDVSISPINLSMSAADTGRFAQAV